MENLDLCILRFHYGLHPGHNLRKTAGSNNPAGRLSSFCNESQRAPHWCMVLALPSSGQVLTSWRPIGLWFSLWRETAKPPAVKAQLQGAASSKERNRRLCASSGKAVRGRSSWCSWPLLSSASKKKKKKKSPKDTHSPPKATLQPQHRPAMKGSGMALDTIVMFDFQQSKVNSKD